MDTWGFTLYKTFDFDWFLTFAVREYPIQNNSLFLRGTGKLKNLKSPAQRKIPIQIGIVFVQTQSSDTGGKNVKTQSPQYKRRLVKNNASNTEENS